MARKTKVLTSTLYAYVRPESRKFVIQEAKRLQTPGGASGYIEDLIVAKMKRSRVRKKEPSARAGNKD